MDSAKARALAIFRLLGESWQHSLRSFGGTIALPADISNAFDIVPYLFNFQNNSLTNLIHIFVAWCT